MARQIALSGLFMDYPWSGTWTYTRNLAPALAKLDRDTHYTLWTRRVLARGCGDFPHAPGLAVCRVPSPFPTCPSRRSWVERSDKLYWEMVAWPLAARHADLLHALHFAAPVLSPAPLVVTVHDVIPLRIAGYARSRAASWYANLMRRTVRRARAIITVSEHSREEIAETLDFPLENIYVTPEAPDPSLLANLDPERGAIARERHAIPSRYVLYLGGTERRKNVETLVHAWAGVHAPEVKLLIVGRYPRVPDALHSDVPGLVTRLGLWDRVQVVPGIGQQDLAAVYAGALLFAFPSLHEGFGLPPLEAMACGAPVVAANASCLPETIGDGAQLLPPTDEAAWAETITGLINDDGRRQALRERGRRHVARFSWHETARKTLEVYNRVLSA